MPFITASKSGPLNWLEGFALTTILQGFPIFAAASLMVKLLGDYRGSTPVLTIAMASVFYSIFVVSVGSAFPRVKERLRSAILRREPVLLRKDRPLAREARDVAAAHGVSAAVVTAGDDRGVRDHLVIPGRRKAADAQSRI